MTNSNILEKVKILSVAAEYAQKAGRVWDSNLYLGEMYECPPSKDILNFMETFHTLDGFVYGSCAESGLFGCDPANHWTIQVGYSESTPNAWAGDDKSGNCEAYAVVTYNRKGVRKIRVFNICAPLAEVYANLYLNPTETSIYRSKFESSKGVITDE